MNYDSKLYPDYRRLLQSVLSFSFAIRMIEGNSYILGANQKYAPIIIFEADVLYLREKRTRVTGLLWSVKVCTAVAVYYHLNFSLSSCVFVFYFFQDTPVRKFTENPGTIYCRHLDRVSPQPPCNTGLPIHAIYIYRRFLSLNLLKLLCSRVSRSFQFGKFLQMSYCRQQN